MATDQRKAAAVSLPSERLDFLFRHPSRALQGSAPTRLTAGELKALAEAHITHSSTVSPPEVCDWTSDAERKAVEDGQSAAFEYSETGGGPIGVFTEGLRAYRAALSRHAAQSEADVAEATAATAIWPNATTAGKSMETAPYDRTILVWWPIVSIDEETGDLTDTEVDGRWLVTEWNGGCWLEPDVLNALNSVAFDDDCEYARNPKLWLDLPTALPAMGQR